MDRRSFLKTSALGGTVAATTGTLAAPAVAQGSVTWRMVTTWPKSFPGLGTGAQRLADRITAASDGALTVQVFAAGELVPPLQSIDALIDGSAEMMHAAPYYWQNKSTALSFFSGVPFGLTTGEHSAWVRHLGGQEIWDEVYGQFGLQGFLSGSLGINSGGWFKKELTGLADVQGLRFRTPGLGGQVWQMLGASVTNLAAGEVFQALSAGTLDAVEFAGPYNDLALGFHQVSKHYYTSSFVEPGQATELVVDKAKYQALPTHLQAIVRDVCQAEYDNVASEYYANDPRALATLVRDHGVIRHDSFPEDILAAGAKASQDLLASIRETGDALTRKAADSFFAAREILRGKTDSADLSYLAARRKYL